MSSPLQGLFQVAVTAFVLLSFLMIVGVPVAFASGQNWEQSRRLVLLGSGAWVALLLVVGAFNFLVV